MPVREGLRDKKRTMRKAKHILCVLLLALCAGGVPAQTEEVNLGVSPQRVATLRQGRIENLSFVDGNLCMSIEGKMYSAPVRGQTVAGLDMDAALMNMDEDITYVVRHPATGKLYFTKVTRYWRSTLYEYRTDGRRAKGVEVKLGDFDFDVNHPVFTGDGKVMVFTTRHPEGEGGQDLWYCRWDGSAWGQPRPLGKGVNSAADEKTPCIGGEYLYFSSNRGHQDSSDYDLYACRLVSAQQLHGDTVSPYPIGKGRVQRLPAPFSSRQCDCDLVYDAGRRCGFWVVRSLGDSAAQDWLFSFAGDLTGVRLSGAVDGKYVSAGLDGGTRQIVEKQRSPLADVAIAVRDAASPFATPLYVTRSDAQGRYLLYLQPQRDYRITFSKEGFFSHDVTLTAKHSGTDTLYESMSRDVQLQGYYLNVDYVYDQRQSAGSLFAPAVGSTLSAQGRRRLSSIAQYLAGNPQLHLYITVLFTEGEENFNRLLAYSREDAIQQYLWQQGVPAKMLNDAKYETIVAPRDSRDTLTNAVFFFFSDQVLQGAKDNDLWDSNENSLRHFLDAEEEENAAPQAKKWLPEMQPKKAPQPAGEPSARPRVEPAAPAKEEGEEEEPAEISPEFRRMMEEGK